MIQLRMVLLFVGIPEQGEKPWRTHRCDRGQQAAFGARHASAAGRVTASTYRSGKAVACWVMREPEDLSSNVEAD